MELNNSDCSSLLVLLQIGVFTPGLFFFFLQVEYHLIRSEKNSILGQTHDSVVETIFNTITCPHLCDSALAGLKVRAVLSECRAANFMLTSS